MEKYPKFVCFILLVKLKTFRNHTYDLKGVLANAIKVLKIHYIVILLFCKINFYRNITTFYGDFSIECGPQVA